jgi:ubiquitin C-terminal hydrolase
MNQIKIAEYETLYSKSSKFNPLNSRAELREASNPVGLLNISNCCYLNSLTQCYFLMSKFKEIILSA